MEPARPLLPLSPAVPTKAAGRPSRSASAMVAPVMVSSRASAATRRIRFSSSRTFPGQP